MDSPHSISTFGIDEQNELYLVDFDFISGQIYRFMPTVTGLRDTPPPSPRSLVRNYPNPFNPQTTIEFIVEAPSFVELDIFDVSGRAVRKLVGRFFGEGTHKVSWDGKNDAGHPVTSGLYFYRYRLDGRNAETKRMALLK